MDKQIKITKRKDCDKIFVECEMIATYSTRNHFDFKLCTMRFTDCIKNIGQRKQNIGPRKY